MALRIRAERAEDAPAIYPVVQAAFSRSQEADLVDTLRLDGHVVLALVALLDGELVGHLLVSPATVRSPAGDWSVLALGPLAVAPAYQRRGIGSRLVRRGLARCRRSGHRVMVVLGHPAYYPRFGFRPAAPLGVRCEFDVPDDAFMLLELVPGALDGRQGTVSYAPAFHTQ